MIESNVSRSNGHSSDMLWGFWYPALRSEQVRRHKLVRAMLLDVPLVLGRDAAGKPFALRDVCPHRAFPLSVTSPHPVDCISQFAKCQDRISQFAKSEHRPMR